MDIPSFSSRLACVTETRGNSTSDVCGVIMDGAINESYYKYHSIKKKNDTETITVPMS